MANGLTPTQKQVLKVLTNPEQAAEESREIAAIMRTTSSNVDKQMSQIYRHYGVRSSRGLLRLSQIIAKDLGE